MKVYQRCVALLIAMSLGGCASLRIDVDVYKGPLFNEQTVQRQQLISMALASKVLLEAEFDDQNKLCKSPNASQDQKLRCRLLTEILSLYAAKSDEANTFSLAKNSLTQFLNLEKRKDSLFDEKFKPNVQANTALQREIVQYIFNGLSPRAALTELRKLTDIDWLNDSKQSFSSADLLRLLADKRLRPNIKKQVNLAWPDWIEFEKQIDSFIDISVEQRKELNRMAKAILIDEVPSERSSDSPLHLRYIAFENSYLLEALQVRNLACAFEIASGETSVARARQILVAQKPHAILGGSRKTMPKAWNKGDYDDAKEELRYLLNLQDRHFILSAIRAANHTFKGAGESEIRACKSLSKEPDDANSDKFSRSDLERVLSKAARESGVFSVTINKSEKLAKNLEALVPALAELSTGVTAGRLEEGIEQLSDKYVQSQAMKEQPNFSALGKAIISLGERMRYLAVNWWIVDSNVGTGSDLGFKTTLEAVGNALVSQSNEAVAKDNYDLANLKRSSFEKEAIDAAFPNKAKNLMEKLLSDLNMRKDNVAAANKVITTNTKALNEAIKVAKNKKNESTKLSDQASKLLDSQIETRLGAFYTFALSRDVPYAESAAQPLKDALMKAKSTISIADKTTIDELRKELGNTGKVNDPASNWVAVVKLKAQLANASNPASIRSKIYDASLNFSESRLDPKGKAIPSSVKELTEQALSFLNDASETILAASKGVEQAQANLNSATGELSKIDNEVKGLAKESDVASIEAAIRIVSEVQGSFVASVGPGLFEDTKVFYVRLKDYLKEKDATALTPSVIAAIDSASVTQIRAVGGRTPQEILDALYSDLSLRHIEAIASMGSKSSKALYLAEAAQRVKDRRAELVYLRPAASYLRSIHNSILSQTQAGLKWRNTLSDQFVKSIPLIGANLWNKESGVASQNISPAIAESIDKASWQTINSVTLNGGGYSNYVVAKDDVGNWYVKALGSDPAKMIQSAKNLLLFNLGSRIDQNLLELNDLKAVRRSQLEKGTSTDAIDSAIASNQATTNAGGAAFEAVIARYRERYNSDLEKEFNALMESISKQTVFENALKAAENASKGLNEEDALAVKKAIEQTKGSFPAVSLFENGTLQIGIKRAETLNAGLVALKEWVSVAKKEVQMSGKFGDLETRLAGEVKIQTDLGAAEKVAATALLADKDSAAVPSLRTTYDNAKAASNAASAVVASTQGELALKKEKIASVNAAIDKAVIVDVVRPTVERRKAAIKDIEKAVLIVSEAAGL
jgi:hypothetical protein